VKDIELVQRAKALLDRLAETPRFAGSVAESRSRALCRDELESAGFTCVERAFEFSEWPARWGPPLATLVQVSILLVAMRLAARGDSLLAVVVLAAAMGTLSVIGKRIRRNGVLGSRYARSTSTNLEATRGKPRVWVVAHLDSKSQTVPMLVRIASAVALQGVSLLVLAAIVKAMAAASVSAHVWPILETAVVVASVPTLFCFVHDHSPGALDNATGVVAALLAASQPTVPRDLGVLITSGEELGLAGARAWAANAPADIIVLNCDTFDDVGGWRCMYSGSAPTRVMSIATRVGRSLELSIRAGRLIPGILADNIAFADVGIDAVTLSRGNLSTLARIHTRRDTSIALTGQGAAEGGVLLSALARELS
jgi:hypothetical protein